MARGVKKAVRGRRQFFEKTCRSDLGKFFPNRALGFGSAESSPDRAQLDGVDEAVLGNDIGDDDDFVAGRDVTEAAQGEDGVLDGDVGLGGERQEVGLDGAEQADEPELIDALERLAERQHKIERAAHDIVTGRTE